MNVGRALGELQLRVWELEEQLANGGRAPAPNSTMANGANRRAPAPLEEDAPPPCKRCAAIALMFNTSSANPPAQVVEQQVNRVRGQRGYILEAVIKILEEHGALRSVEIAQLAGIKTTHMNTALFKLAALGKIMKTGSKRQFLYSLP